MLGRLASSFLSEFDEPGARLLPAHAVGAPKPAVEAARDHIQAPEGEIGKVDVERGFRMLEQVAPAHRLGLVRAGREPLGLSQQG